MNANELADDMENGKFNDANYNRKKAADFVRQLQNEIEALKKEARAKDNSIAAAGISTVHTLASPPMTFIE